MAGSDVETPAPETAPGNPPDPAAAPAASLPPARSAAVRIGEALGVATARVEAILRDPARRKQVIGAAIGGVLLIALLAALPALTRRGTPSPAPAPAAEAPAPAEGQPAPAPAPAPAEGQPAEGAPPAAAPAAAPSLGRAYLLAALPLLLGLFWLLSAWLVDSEARRAFVVQEPWGERRTVAYTALAVGCVFPLILAGLIFSAWGFVTFILDVSRRQSPIAALQAASLILLVFAVFLVLRGLVAQWIQKRRASRA